MPHRAALDLFAPDRKNQGQRILISRGCRSHCSYCGFGPHHKRQAGSRGYWQPRDPREIVNEIEQVQRRHGVDYFIFQAAVFFGYDHRGSEHIEELCRRILHRGLSIRFKLVTHPGHLLRNQHLLPLLQKAGLDLVFLGVDSGVTASLQRFQVEFTVEDGLAAMALLHENNIELSTGFLFYEPYMTLANVAEQIEYLRRARPYFSHMKPAFGYWLDKKFLSSMLAVKPFMPMAEELEADGLVTRTESVPWAPVTTMRFRHSETSSFYRAHKKLQQALLTPLRPILWHRHSEERIPALAELPLDLLEQTLDLVQNDPEPEESSYLAAATERITDVIAPFMTDADLDNLPGMTAGRRSRIERILHRPMESS